MLEQYIPFVGEETLQELFILSRKLKDLKVLHVNSTYKGGGVAEILQRFIPLMNELGIKTDWKVFKGDEKFFSFTKKLHNLLHLPSEKGISSEEFVYYLKITYENLKEIDTENYDVVFIHDPQPMGLIVNKQKKQKWIWRCHIDTSTPDPRAWNFIENFLNSYDACIFHMPEFVYEKIEIPTYTILPSIDPLHPKNIDLSEEEIKNTLTKFGINPEKPIILQVSRFDRLKDPFGVIEAFKLVKKKYDCQLILAGSFASDDPEGEEVYKELLNLIADERDILVLNLPPDSHKEINAFQRGATVVVQKSLKEGFGLVVSEAMWKSKPVVGSNVGGIKRQIVHGITGYLVESVEGAAMRIKQLLANKHLREKMGFHAKERVKHRFLIIRHLRDYLLLIYKILNQNS
ncbi:glycosyl transferase group 1 [Thermodesulfobacterium geofontis OPF15]|jgi:trehalose synthase|uniref:Glycosyl transferase group 1 n=1 Tax=Thermodesulfobacterium geofontis (strain OPF15) TaxID=795359 RepID=F8C483_THEGP|nr:glycosyltransferase [Thermodesulfobacterium geofontis]AEH22584.1 glycosyl transferase group 1 [Thermodesulfobacterium geofontis OPF15]